MRARVQSLGHKYWTAMLLKVSLISKKEKTTESYWSATLKLLGIILAIWAIVSFGASIIFVDFLNQFYLGGYPLGFWFAQQGSIYIFIALIFIYILIIGKIDKKYDVHESEEGAKK